MRRVGVLLGLPEYDSDTQTRLATFRLALEKLGWLEGDNVAIDIRFASAFSANQAQPLAKELLALQPDVILAQGTSLVAATQRETRIKPIVFVNVSDPIGSGFVTSLARPGGNVTGFLNFEASITGKWLAMLKEIAPSMIRAALVANPETTPFDYFVQVARAVATSLAIELVPSRVETAADIERTIESFALVPNGGLVLPPDNTTNLHRDLIIALATRHRLPAVYGLRNFAIAGGLMSYDHDRVEHMRQAADYVDRILRGDKPGDLPVQAPTKYQTIINLKTASALGLTVPRTLLALADEVIE